MLRAKWSGIVWLKQDSIIGLRATFAGAESLMKYFRITDLSAGTLHAPRTIKLIKIVPKAIFSPGVSEFFHRFILLRNSISLETRDDSCCLLWLHSGTPKGSFWAGLRHVYEREKIGVNLCLSYCIIEAPQKHVPQTPTVKMAGLTSELMVDILWPGPMVSVSTTSF